MREPSTLVKPIDLHGRPAPAASFEVPLEMLAACHSRVEGQCDTFRRLLAHVCEQGPALQAREAAVAVMRYFDTSARHHHADEDVDLFPALIESMAGSDAVCLQELTASLTAEHRELEQCCHSLRPSLQQVAGGHAAALPGDEVLEFIGLYERHIAREESELLPMARRLLSDAELDRIGLAMRARRDASDTVDLPRPSPA